MHCHFMRARLVIAAVCAATLAAPAFAQTGPVIAIPGKFGVPVIMNGVIVDGAVIWGDWGLARPTSWRRGRWTWSSSPPPPYDSRELLSADRTQAARRPPGSPADAAIVRVRHELPARLVDRSPTSVAPVTEYPPYDPPPVILAPRGRRF